MHGWRLFVRKEVVDKGTMRYSITSSSPEYTDQYGEIIDAFASMFEMARYHNLHDEPHNQTRKVIVGVDDGASATEQTCDVRVKLTIENAPVLNVKTYAFNFIEQGGAIPIVSPVMTLHDKDHNHFFPIASAEVYPGHIRGADGDVLTVASHPTIASSYDKISGVLHLVGDAPVLDYEELLRTLSFNNTLDEPTIGHRGFGIRVFDSSGHTSNQEVIDVRVVAVNDKAPVVLTLPFYTFREDIDEKLHLGYPST
jgi:hypothetical protein